MFNPAKASEQIKKEYMGYISTSFRFRNQELQAHLLKELDKSVSKGPFIEIKDIFLTGKTIEQMISEGKISSLFKNLENGKPKGYNQKLPVNRPLYLHQEKAIEKIISGKNVVVSTGTGSGKTNCFLIPVINHLLNEKNTGKLNAGVRAIFIYPMNALANDQIKNLREILMYYPEITFGVYNGVTEHDDKDATKLYKAMYANDEYPELKDPLPNEFISREKMQNTPPHILFTNYSMLEHMLFRPKDDTIFSNSNFNYVILDEAHVYTGATGIETALLMSRLKGRLNGERAPQFILTSATLGNGTQEDNEKIVKFAKNLTGCEFYLDDIILAERNISTSYPESASYPPEVYIDLANDELFLLDVLKKNNIAFNKEANEEEIIYDLIYETDIYAKLRALKSPIIFDDFVKKLNIERDTAVSFVSLCAKAQKKGKALVDIRYHYFLRALDGGFLALDFPESFSLIRKDTYYSDKMFEIAVCEDCGEIALVGKQENGKLSRMITLDDREYYQILNDDNSELLRESEELDDDFIEKCKKNPIELFVLCKSCGAIIGDALKHNSWCSCKNTKPVNLVKLPKDKCLHCNGGRIRKFNLGYEAATGVISTSLFEQIPEYMYEPEENKNISLKSDNIFGSVYEKKKYKREATGQFLIFSDSRQGAAKFACYLEDSYKEFLRRRGIWNVSHIEEKIFSEGKSVSEFVKCLINYFSSHNLFRKNNAANAQSFITENRRNAWVAILNEMYNSGRDTSLVSLGKIQFEYRGNTEQIIETVASKYNVNKNDAKHFLNYLAFDIVRVGAIIPDKDTDIDSSDREYIFYTQAQKTITKYKDTSIKPSSPFMPTSFQKKNGEISYYRSNKLKLTKDFFKLGNEEAVKFLELYWDYILVSESNEYCLQRTKNGRSYFAPADCFNIFVGKSAKLWKCEKCQKVSQFNISNKCIKPNCKGLLKHFDAEEFWLDDYYSMRYESEKLTPLFVKEHTAQLAKKDALEYQQEFIRKEINALSCSTTFEMGVDLGDLETVFLRNFPPLPSNYSQRTGRAGRSINAAAFALTYARLGSHDFTFFERPQDMINGFISPPQFKLENEKIIKRHIYAVSLSLFLKNHSELYNGNNASKFVNEKGYKGFLDWIDKKPIELNTLLKNSIPRQLWDVQNVELETFGWLKDFCGDEGKFTLLVQEFEKNIKYLQSELERAHKSNETKIASIFENKLHRYKNNELIDFLVRGNILPKYGFPIDAVELMQNINSKSFKSLNLSRDLSIAIAEYAPSAEVVADGKLYTSRYIKKPLINKNEISSFKISYIAKCKNCDHINYTNMPISQDGIQCDICGNKLLHRYFSKSIQPIAGFIAEEEPKDVPLSSQERKYKTEAIYIGDKNAHSLEKYEYIFNETKITIESTSNDSLVVKSTEYFYICSSCGYSIASNESSKLSKYKDYKKHGPYSIKEGPDHVNPFGKGICENKTLFRYWLHHEFKTDVAKITFNADTSDNATMLSVMYALLKSFTNTLNIEHRDMKACLTCKNDDGKWENIIILYDDVPGGAGHSRGLVTEDGETLKKVIENAIKILDSCDCEPSCYKCLRSYENQKIHEILNRHEALKFFNKMKEGKAPNQENSITARKIELIKKSSFNDLIKKEDTISNSIEQSYEILKQAKKYILQIIETCKLHNKKPIFVENNLLRLWDDLEKQCTSRSEYKLFTETLYKLLKENTRYKNPNYKNKTDPFYIFMLPEEFYRKNQETKDFIFIIDTLRHFYVHDEIGKSGDVFEKLLGKKSGPQTDVDYQRLQNEILLKFEKSMEILLSIVKKEFELPKNL